MLHRILNVAGKVLHPEITDRNTKVIPRYVFQLVSFIENHGGSFRQNSRIRRAVGLQLNGKISEKEVMVHDDDVALHRAPPHLGDEASLPLAALLANASIGPSIEFVPEQAGLWKFSQFRAVAGRSRLFPSRDRLILLNLFQTA